MKTPEKVAGTLRNGSLVVSSKSRISSLYSYNDHNTASSTTITIISRDIGTPCADMYAAVLY